MTRIALASLASLAAVASFATAQPLPTPADNDIGDDNQVIGGVQHQNLTILPIVSVGAHSDDDYLTLDEGMKSKKVRINELNAAGSVNELRLKNRSDKPLFVMSGEVIIGGKQDRIIGKNIVVPPNSEQTIPVFCVEHGRWSGRRTEFASAGALADNKLRGRAEFEDQGKVWKEVSEKNAKRGAANGTDTYRHVAAMQAKGSIASWNKAIKAQLAEMSPAARANLVGYAVALNGSVVALDVFDSPKLFAKLEGKLLRSYITEAIDEPVAKDIKTPTGSDVRAFLAKAEAAPEQAVFDNDAAATLNSLSEDAASTKVRRKGAPAAAKPVYKSAKRRN